jgi:hypothetical protein
VAYERVKPTYLASAIVRKKGSYEHAFNSERSFVCEGWMKSEIDEREVDTPGELLARILDAAFRIKNVKINSDDQHADFARDLPNASRLTVGFLNICWEL